MYYGQSVIIERVNKFLERYAYCYYGESSPLAAACTIDDDAIPFRELAGRKWARIQVGECWASQWQSAWFRFSGRVPASWRGGEVVAVIDTGSEACLFDGRGNPVCGLTSKAKVTDSLYRKAMIPLHKKAKGGEEVELLVEAAANELMGLQGEARLRACHLALFRRDLWHLLHDLIFLFDLAVNLPQEEPGRARILRALDQAVNAYGNGGTEEVTRARSLLQAQIEARAASTAPEVSAIGHGHLDLVWLWPLRETVRKAGRTFSSTLLYMEEYPEYRFGASQPQLYQLVKERYPELFSRIRRAVSQGRWEPLGAMWVEPDCNIPSGESLVRQIYYGKRFFREEFGVEVDNLWLPDTFGFSPVLPQLMRGSGLKHFMSQKMCWNKTNQFPYHSFVWVGNDGSRVFAHFLPSNTMNSKVLPAELLFGAGNFRQKDRCRRWLFSFGEGDGGGGPGRHHLELARRAGNCQGLPRLTQRFARDFFRLAEQEAVDFPEWHGELYLETHRGTLTTCGKTKADNRKSEIRLHDLELLLLLNHVLLGAEYPAARLEKLWKTLLLHQFHDILPGTTIHLAFEESSKSFEQLISESEGLIEQALRTLAAGPDRVAKEAGRTAAGPGRAAKGPGSLLLMNPTGFARRQVCQLPLADWKPEEQLLTKNGESIPVQRSQEGIFLECSLPPHGFVLLRRQQAAGKPADVKSLRASARLLENSKLRLEFSREGTLKRIFDKEEQREVLAKADQGNRLLLYPDVPIGYDAWDIDPYYRTATPEPSRLLSVEVKEQGPLCVSLLQKRSVSRSEIVQEIRLYRDSRLVEFRTRVEWREDQRMLKALFPVNVRAESARFDIQFGNISRPSFKNTSWEQARYEVFAHKWVDLSEHGYGVALLNDCKYGHNVDRNVLELTLLRAPIDPDPQRDRGSHSFTYALLPHRGDFREGEVIPAAYFLNFPLLLVQAGGQAEQDPRAARLENRALFCVDSPNVVLETVKRSELEEAVVVRLYESYGSRGEVVLRTPFGVLQAREADLQENDLDALPVQGDEKGSAVRFYIKPYQIKTIKLWLSAASPAGSAS